MMYMKKEHYGDPPEDNQVDPVVSKLLSKADSNKNSATKLLKHYFSLAFSFPTTGDIETEIEDIVHHIIEAAKNEAIAEITQKLNDGEI